MRITRIITILLIGVLLILGACGPLPTLSPADVTTSALTIEPNAVRPFDTVKVGVTVTNNGEQRGTYEVVLKIKNNTFGTEEDKTQNISLAGGTSQKVTFIFAGGEGMYTLTIDQLTNSLRVEPNL